MATSLGKIYRVSERLIKLRVNINEKRKDGLTAFNASCYDVNLELIKLLLKNNVDISGKYCKKTGFEHLEYHEKEYNIIKKFMKDNNI